MYFLILGASFILILTLNVLTPLLSDDYSYLMTVMEADSFLDLFAQEYQHYMTWSGRSVLHLLLRIFLFLPGWIFKIANSLAFIALGVIMTRFVSGEDKRYDWVSLLMVQLTLWLFAVDPSQTLLWEDGACNYLWGGLIILSFMYLAKRLYRGSIVMWTGAVGILQTAGFLLLGLLAGWCNENTSGGCLLYVLYLLIQEYRTDRHMKLPLILGAAGNLAGLMLMVLSPGEQARAAYGSDENYTGFLGLLSRFQKITLNIREYFGILLMVLLICWVIMYLQRNGKGAEQSVLFSFLFAATCYALILTRPTQARALFGAGLFLDIALITAVRSIIVFEEENPRSGTGILMRAAAYGGCAALTLTFLFEYADNATNTARIWRDENTRITYIEEQAALGATEIIVPLVHTDFYNEYSAIEDMEMTDDPGYWINVFYELYYGVDSISAIDYDEWEDLIGVDEAE